MKLKRCTIMPDRDDPDADLTTASGYIREKSTHVYVSVSASIGDADQLDGAVIVVSGAVDDDHPHDGRRTREFTYGGEVVDVSTKERTHSTDRFKLKCQPAAIDDSDTPPSMGGAVP